jgi:hypothetical protein
MNLFDLGKRFFGRATHMSNGTVATDPIQHVIVLMLENHSFDRMLGCFQDVYPVFDGIPSSKPPRTNDANGVAYWQVPGARLAAPMDPNHDYEHVLTQIGNGNSGFAQDFADCFPQAAPADVAEVMKYHARGALPALHTLAENSTTSHTGWLPDENEISNVNASPDGSGTWNTTCKAKVYVCSAVASVVNSESYCCTPVAN